ncbi:Protein of unknown function [Cotesia congregata]|uniref:Uncharacterized protein n=1 Tax=Cotesia congregata TaxID=51543 RepID=A0A8J2HEK4_COTCN|nr:Protein of unknown function [Cotesia congregata]
MKTKVMILGSKSKLKILEKCDLPIIVDGNIIPHFNSTKHLGIHLSTNLTWDDHVAQLSRKVFGVLKSLKHKRNILSTSTRKLLVTSTILLIIDYCSFVLLDSSKRLDNKLQRLINIAIRFILNLKCDVHITPHRHSLNWLNIKSRQSYFLACFFYKLLATGEPKFLRALFRDEDPDIRRSDRLASKQ